MNVSRLLTCVAPSLRVGIGKVFNDVKPMSLQISRCICLPLTISLNESKQSKFVRSRCKYYSKQVKSCWKCTSPVHQYDLFCKSCNSVQRLDASRNYFDLFGLRESYKVDLKAVQNTFRDLQRLLHPDVFSRKDEEERKLSEEHSSLVNKAYSTLMHPLRRALYMLRLKGIDVEETPVNMSQDFLLDIMEKNEEVDGLEDVNEIQRLSQIYKNVMQKHAEDVEIAFNEEDLEKAKEIVSRMKYFSNLEMKLRDLKQKFGILD